MADRRDSDSSGFRAELIPDSYFEPLDLVRCFGRSAPLEVDLGCGDGSFIATRAEQLPTRNFLGIERLAGRVRSACHKITGRNLSNVRILRAEISYTVRYLLPAQSVNRFHLAFPDPWPKKRHARRRLVTAEFLQSVAVALEANGTIRCATDQPQYFAQISHLAQESGAFSQVESDREDHLSLSTFEARFREAQTPIYRVELRKTFPPRCVFASH